MRRAVRVCLLVLSHVGVMAVAAATTADALVKREWREASNDPMYRISVHFDLEDSERPQSSFESDLRQLHDRPEPTTAVLRLMAHLRGLESGGKPQYEAAAKDCAALGWPKCDKQALVEMRKHVVR